MGKSKGKIGPVLNYHAMKTYPLLNKAQRHEDVLKECRCSYTHL